jgi:hypothetical protein
MRRAIHHWPIRKNVTVVAAATALPKGMIIPKMRREIPSTGHFEDMHIEKLKGPPGGPFLISRPSPSTSRVLKGLREKALELCES